MLYIDKKVLTVIKIKKQQNTIPLDEIKNIDNISNYIYIELDDKIYGIITINNIKDAYHNKTEIKIEKEYTYLNDKNYIKALELFKEKNIDSIPIIKDNKLIGEYQRNDNYYPNIINNKYAIRYFTKIKIVFVKSNSDKKNKILKNIEKEFRKLDLKFRIINNDEIEKYYNKVDNIIFIDNIELENTIINYMINKNIVLNNPYLFITYKKLFYYINKTVFVDCLLKIQRKGIIINTLIFWDTHTPYFNNLVENFKVSKKYEDVMETVYDKDTARKIAWTEYKHITKNGITYLEDIESEFYNVKNGERKTVDQPSKYDKTIYFIGPCLMVGSLAKDEHTIESFLQKKLNENGYKIKVVNYGAWGLEISKIEQIVNLPLKKNDIIVAYIDNITDDKFITINLFDVLEKYNVDHKYLADSPVHCVSKVNKLYADEIYNNIESYLDTKDNKPIKLDNSLIIDSYINKYFYNKDLSKYNNIGSIVMNCNPFTKGHKYLIEQSLKKCDLLIIFVVEEDKSIFDFETRYKCVCEGCKDLDNVLIVPSGSFILSNQTFPQYFVKIKDDKLSNNIKYDLELFSKYIAPKLNIKYRFVGEELSDEVTNEYNRLMKQILPKYNIELVEIERKKTGSEYISATKVRKLIQDKKYNELDKYIPDTIKKIIFGELKKD